MGENLMDASILMSFNKLKNIVRDGGLDTEEGLALVSKSLGAFRVFVLSCLSCLSYQIHFFFSVFFAPGL